MDIANKNFRELSREALQLGDEYERVVLQLNRSGIPIGPSWQVIYKSVWDRLPQLHAVNENASLARLQLQHGVPGVDERRIALMDAELLHLKQSLAVEMEDLRTAINAMTAAFHQANRGAGDIDSNQGSKFRPGFGLTAVSQKVRAYILLY